MITSYSRELMLGIPQGTLSDLETTGLDADHDEIVLLGYIQGNRLEIVCRSSEEEAPFAAQLAALVSTLPRPFYAYNLSFERGFLQAKGIHIEDPQNYYQGMGGLDLHTAPFWIFSQAARFLLGFGQPYNQGYSYNNCGCLAPPTYYRVIYPVTRIIPSWYYPNYYPTGYFGPGAMGAYGWGPSTRYISRVTNINPVTINNYITRTPVNNIHNSLPPNHWRDRNRMVYDRNTPNQNLLAKNRPMQVTNTQMALRNLNRPNVLTQPAGLKPLDAAKIHKATPVTQIQPGASMKGMGFSNKATQQVTPQMTERIHPASRMDTGFGVGGLAVGQHQRFKLLGREGAQRLD